jgi:bacterioferritin-associated ferredoxin
MFVCNCNGLRLCQVKTAIERGAQQLHEVYRTYGCAPKCGKCVPEVRTLIKETREAVRLAAE